MSKKQKKILIDVAFLAFIAMLAFTPIFNGKTGIQLLSGMLADDIKEAVEK